MSNYKIVRMPISYEQRKLNEYGKGYVPCEVSTRWLQFPEKTNHEKWIPVDVMTHNEGNEPRKICELIISKEDILRAINNVKIEE